MNGPNNIIVHYLKMLESFQFAKTVTIDESCNLKRHYSTTKQLLKLFNKRKIFDRQCSA